MLLNPGVPGLDGVIGPAAASAAAAAADSAPPFTELFRFLSGLFGVFGVCGVVTDWAELGTPPPLLPPLLLFDVESFDDSFSAVESLNIP